MRIYVASSWRNEHQPAVVSALRYRGHDVYDFRRPSAVYPGGFHWSDIDPDWQRWTPAQFREALDHPVARRGFDTDFLAMKWADGCVLVLPSGRSAHLEAGFMAAAGKFTAIYMPEPQEPELMYRLLGPIQTDLEALLGVVEAAGMEG